MDRNTGEIRELIGDPLKPLDPTTESVFKVGELVSLKGCTFSIGEIYPNPQNKLVLFGRPSTTEESKMI